MKKALTRLAWPLTESEIEQVHHTALEILEKIGMGKPPEKLKSKALARGCTPLGPRPAVFSPCPGGGSHCPVCPPKSTSRQGPGARGQA